MTAYPASAFVPGSITVSARYATSGKSFSCPIVFITATKTSMRASITSAIIPVGTAIVVGGQFFPRETK